MVAVLTDAPAACVSRSGLAVFGGIVVDPPAAPLHHHLRAALGLAAWVLMRLCRRGQLAPPSPGTRTRRSRRRKLPRPPRGPCRLPGPQHIHYHLHIEQSAITERRTS